MRRIKRYFNRTGLGFGLLLLLILGGCKSSKQVGTVTPGAAKAKQAFFQAMEEQALHFQTLTARLGVEINLPNFQVNSTRVDLKMIKDSAFQLSVQPLLGIELFRLELSRDSIKVLDRMNKRYLAENYEAIRSQTPIAFNFYNLQALLTNRLFLPGEREIKQSQYDRFRLDQTGAKALIQAKDAMGFGYLFEADGEEKLLATEMTDAKEQYRLRWGYADFRMVDKQIFPQGMTIEVFKEGNVEGQMQWGISRMRLDEPVKLDFVIPAKYIRMTLEQLVRTLKNLNA